MIELLTSAALTLSIITTAIFIVRGIKSTNCSSCNYSYLKGYCNPHRYCKIHNRYVEDDFICTNYQGGKKK